MKGGQQGTNVNPQTSSIHTLSPLSSSSCDTAPGPSILPSPPCFGSPSCPLE